MTFSLLIYWLTYSTAAPTPRPIPNLLRRIPVAHADDNQGVRVNPYFLTAGGAENCDTPVSLKTFENQTEG